MRVACFDMVSVEISVVIQYGRESRCTAWTGVNVDA